MICGLDYGERRIGVALSDETETLAHGETELANEPKGRWVEQLKALLVQNSVRRLVVGLPKTMKGEIGPAAAQVLKCVDQLRPQLQIDIETWDERLSTQEAMRFLRETPVSGSKRRKRVDRLAAQI